MNSRRPFAMLENLESRVLLTSLAAPAMVDLNGVPATAVERGQFNYFPRVSINSLQPSGAPPSSNATLVAPSNLTATASTTTISLRWTDNSSNETGERIYRSTDGINFSLLTSLGKNRTSYSDSQVAQGVTYSYKVLSYSSNSTSAYSNTATATLSTPVVQLPNTPTNLAPTSTTTSTIALHWSDNASNESGYRLYRSTDGTNYTLITSLGINATSFTDSGLAAGATYLYKVAAWNSAGESTSASLTTGTQADPTPPPTDFTTDPVTISTPYMTSFTELRIDGTSGNDSIVVTQSGGILNITANGQSYAYANTFGDLVIHGFDANDVITVDSSVNIAALIYGGDGNNFINDLTSAKATIVSLGNGVNTVTGNGLNTAYWVNPADTVNASSTEISLGGVNRVSSFYQPWTTDSSSPDYVPRTLNGQDLRDPSDSGAVKRLYQNSLWGTGPTMNDINQTSIADCYFMAPLASLAYSETAKLTNMAVDLGDGTYAFRFVKNGVTSFVRIDGDLSVGGWTWGLANAMPGNSGNLWGSLFEKAYAFFRSGANTYSSLNYGYLNQSFQDLGLNNTSISASSADTTLLNTINNALNSNKALAANTVTNINGGAPLIGSHAYSVIGAYRDGSGTLMLQLRNPWGIDGAGNDGSDDAIVTIPSSQFGSNFYSLYYTLA